MKRRDAAASRARPGGSRRADAKTGTVRDFTGRAVAGPPAGREPKKVPVLRDYRFDRKADNPRTLVYTAGDRLR